MTPRHGLRLLSVGSLVVAALIVGFVVATPGSGTYTLHAPFDDVRGLIEGGEVRAGAVKVGTVTKVEIGAGDRPMVTMAVDDDFVVHKGATADIRLASNVGAVNRAVELTQGDVTTPPLPDGAHFPAARTDQPVNFDEAVQTLDPRTRADIGRLLSGLGHAVDGRGGDLRRTLRHSSGALGNVADLLAQVNRDGAALRTVVGDGERVVSSLAERPGDLGAAAEEVAALLRTTGSRREELSRSVREVGPALTASRVALGTLADAIPGLRRVARASGPVVDELGPVARMLPELTDSARPLLAQTRRLVEGGPAQLADLGPIARAAIPVAGKLTPVARDALPLARVLQTYVPETVGAFQNFGATGGAYDATGHVLNVASSVVAVPPRNAVAGGDIGPADCNPKAANGIAPGLLRKPFVRVPGVNECQPWTDLPAGILTPSGG